jgi:multiple sugar transport system ATP-binding protein
MAVVTLDRLTKIYERGHAPAADSVSLEIRHGEFMVLLGPSGCGKTTTLRMIAGLESISSGTLSIDDRVVNGVPAKDRDIAMVFQSYALYPHMSVKDNLAFGLRRRAVAREEIERRVSGVAATLGLSPLLDRKPHALSGGQRQRVALGRAIVRDPKVFLFDEPLSNLDAKLRVAMRAEIKALHQRLRTTTVYVTHDQIEAMTMADRIVVMHDGIIEQIGTPLELYDRPGNLFVAQFIGSPAMNVLAGTLRVGAGGTEVEAAGTRWPVPVQVHGTAGQSVHYGIRPGDIHLAPAGSGIAAKVIVVEPTGAETELLLQVGDAQIISVIHGRTGAKPDDTIYLAIDADKAHVFDGASGKRLA